MRCVYCLRLIVAQSYPNRAVKIFADGALGSWGAALHEPYTDKPSERGILISDEAVFAPLIKRWIDKVRPENHLLFLAALINSYFQGFQVCSHAIGDRANTLILNAYEEALASDSDSTVADKRLRIEHAQIVVSRCRAHGHDANLSFPCIDGGRYRENGTTRGHRQLSADAR